MHTGVVSARLRRRWSKVVLGATSTTMVALMLGSANASAAPPSGGSLAVNGALSGQLSAQTVTTGGALSSRLAQSDPAILNLSGTAPTSVLVKLDYDPLATYNGYLPGLAATSPAVTGHKLNPASREAVAYSGHITSVEQAFVSALRKAVPNAAVGQTYHTVYGGLAVTVPANTVASLLKLSGAVAVQSDSLHKADQATPVADDDAEFIGGNAAYSALGSSATAGAGVIVADVDTGVWPEHPSFAARPDLGTPPPTPDGHARACNFGTNPLTSIPFACNDKLIGGQVFLATYNSLLHDEPYPNSARDSEGHGTHTTSTAAGNPLNHASLFGVDRGPIQGIAPGAFVLSYKALGPLGGFDSDLVAAINQAVLDGADVINYSIGPSTPQSAYTSPDDLAFLDAFDAGVFSSTSAGNSGPNAGTTAHLGPWETTVAASSLQRAFASTATISAPGGAQITLQGSTITLGISSPTPVVKATSIAHYDSICSTPAPAGSFTGKIVVCVRGGVDASGNAVGRVQKGLNVKAGGAVGMFLRNPVVEDTETDNHFLPAIHFDKPAGDMLDAFLTAHPGATATFPQGDEVDGQGDVMAAFSSRGPGGDFLKPDITAPGVQILAGNTPTPFDVASGPPGQYFQSIAGTSMSAPHITGSAALVFALHPGFSPAQVKSALMTTANRNVVEQDGHTPAGVFDDGSGRVDLAGVVNPGLTLDVTRKQMDAVLTDPLHRIDLNEPSVFDAALPGRVTTTRTFTNVTRQAQAYQVSATADLAGSVTVSPAVISVPAGASRSISITLDGTTGTPGTFYSGQIELAQLGGTRHLHLPVAFSPSAPAAPAGTVSLTSSCVPGVIHLTQLEESTCTATAQNQVFVPATVNLTTTWADNLTFRSATPGATRTGAKSVTLPVQTLSAATPPAPQIASGDSPFGYFDLARLGVTPRAMGDESISNFTVPGFVFAGQTYNMLGVISDGYLVVGGGDVNDISYLPQHFPNPARPNNVLAPLWTDLDGGNGTITGQGLLIDVVSADRGVHNWIVVQWNAHVFGIPGQVETFQVWLGVNGTEDVSFAYNPAHMPTNPGVPFNVGAENFNGSRGSNLAGLPSGDQVVTSTAAIPGGSTSLSVTLRGNRVLPGGASSTVETDMTSSASRDTTVSRASILVKQ
jgi:subtilisin family serine protease